ALLVQFVGFPYLGTRGVLVVLFLAGIAAGAWCLMRAGAGPRRGPAHRAPSPPVAPPALLVPAPGWGDYTLRGARPGGGEEEGVGRGGGGGRRGGARGGGGLRHRPVHVDPAGRRAPRPARQLRAGAAPPRARPGAGARGRGDGARADPGRRDPASGRRRLVP